MKSKETKLIIRNWTGRSMEEILQRAMQVIEGGRNEYDNTFGFAVFSDKLVCSTTRNSDTSDTLTFYEERDASS